MIKVIFYDSTALADDKFLNNLVATGQASWLMGVNAEKYRLPLLNVTFKNNADADFLVLKYEVYRMENLDD